jgi:protein-tyrosine kinase
MSRIHEALKKAEQDRAAAQSGAPDLNLPRVSRPFDTTPAAVMDRPAVPTYVPAAVPRPVDGTGSGFTEDMLLTRCSRPAWKTDTATMLFFGAEENMQGMEQFRTLRARLCAAREKMPLKTVLVASALPKDGKSFVAANLAQVLSRQQGRRVLLIDGDMRLSSLHTCLGTVSTPGLGDYLLGEADELSAIQRGPLDNLFFLPSGRTVEHPAELISNGRLRLLQQHIGHLFDWIVVDSPPAVPVADASQLAQYADGVLLVVCSNATPYDIAQKARREFQGKTVVGVVLNGTTRDGNYARYAYETYEKLV